MLDFSFMPRGASELRRAAAHSRGFTLTELMVVVTMVGILATVGVASFRREVSASKSVEAAAVVQAIRAAQESYRAENQRYLDVSTSGEWYPANSFGQRYYAWEQASHADLTRWRALGANVTQSVQFRYKVTAGVPGQTMTAVSIPGFSYGVATEPWYVIQARADYDSDGVSCDAVASSLNHELYVQNEGE